MVDASSNNDSGLQVEGHGEVLRLLSDDNHGSRHQRFVLELPSGDTILLVHNIDLSPRIEPIEVGDAVKFYGEYKWNAQGGLVHWVHADPDSDHVDGWIKHNGQVYQ